MHATTDLASESLYKNRFLPVPGAKDLLSRFNTFRNQLTSQQPGVMGNEILVIGLAVAGSTPTVAKFRAHRPALSWVSKPAVSACTASANLVKNASQSRGSLAVS